jgi:hypothetical protein
MNQKYAFDSGAIGSYRMSAAKAAVAANTAPTGAATTKARPSMSKNKREAGIKPRHVTLTRSLTVTQGNDTVTKIFNGFLVILDPTVFAGNSFDIGASVTINSIVWTVADKFVESY